MWDIYEYNNKYILWYDSGASEQYRMKKINIYINKDKNLEMKCNHQKARTSKVFGIPQSKGDLLKIINLIIFDIS